MTTTESSHEGFLMYAKDLAKRKNLTLKQERLTWITLWSNTVRSDDPVLEVLYHPVSSKIQVLYQVKALDYLP